jgi:preprotein translocase subunit YajC
MKTFAEIFTAGETLVGTRTLQAQDSGAGKPAAAQGGALGMFLPMILVFGIFYFLMIRPQQKQRKLHMAVLQNLKKGDDVITSAGIHAKVTGVADNIVTLEIAENVRIKVDKAQVATVKQTAVAA